MTKQLLAGAAMAAGLAFMGGAADAATYITKLEHNNADGVVDGFYGTVTIVEEDANNILVTVDLESPLTMLIDSGKHQAFVFNLDDTPNSSLSVVTPVGGGSYSYLGEGSFAQPPFNDGGKSPVNWKNAFQCCGNGSSNGEPDPFSFRVTNTAGITFAGIGATFDSNGKLLTTGTGNHFYSTKSGWWFAADVSDGKNTGAIAAKDAYLQAVPEPSTWALMILGFGSAGAMLRRRRAVVA